MDYGLKPPRTHLERCAVIAALRAEGQRHTEFNITRDGSAAQVTEYARGMEQANSESALREFHGHGPGEIAVEMITPEVASWRTAAFERQLRAAGVTGDALETKMAWFRSTLNVVTEN